MSDDVLQLIVFSGYVFAKFALEYRNERREMTKSETPLRCQREMVIHFIRSTLRGVARLVAFGGIFSLIFIAIDVLMEAEGFLWKGWFKTLHAILWCLACICIYLVVQLVRLKLLNKKIGFSSEKVDEIMR